MDVKENLAICTFYRAAKTRRSLVNTTKIKQTSVCNYVTELVMLLHVLMLQHGENNKEFGYISMNANFSYVTPTADHNDLHRSARTVLRVLRGSSVCHT
jgi:hypothetical protein